MGSGPPEDLQQGEAHWPSLTHTHTHHFNLQHTHTGMCTVSHTLSPASRSLGAAGATHEEVRLRLLCIPAVYAGQVYWERSERLRHAGISAVPQLKKPAAETAYQACTRRPEGGGAGKDGKHTVKNEKQICISCAYSHTSRGKKSNSVSLTNKYRKRAPSKYVQEKARTPATSVVLQRGSEGRQHMFFTGGLSGFTR